MTNAENLKKCLDEVFQKEKELLKALEPFGVNFPKSGYNIIMAIKRGERILDHVTVGNGEYKS